MTPTQSDDTLDEDVRDGCMTAERLSHLVFDGLMVTREPTTRRGASEASLPTQRDVSGQESLVTEHDPDDLTFARRRGKGMAPVDALDGLKQVGEGSEPSARSRSPTSGRTSRPA